jgi:hypothetical protein
MRSSAVFASEQQHLLLGAPELGAGQLEQAPREVGVRLHRRFEQTARVADHDDTRDRLDAAGMAVELGQPEAVVRAQEIYSLAAAVGDRRIEAHRAADDPVIVFDRIALDHDGLPRLNRDRNANPGQPFELASGACDDCIRPARKMVLLNGETACHGSPG